MRWQGNERQQRGRHELLVKNSVSILGYLSILALRNLPIDRVRRVKRITEQGTGPAQPGFTDVDPGFSLTSKVPVADRHHSLTLGGPGGHAQTFMQT